MPFIDNLLHEFQLSTFKDVISRDTIVATDSYTRMAVNEHVGK